MRNAIMEYLNFLYFLRKYCTCHNFDYFFCCSLHVSVEYESLGGVHGSFQLMSEKAVINIKFLFWVGLCMQEAFL